MFNKIDDRSGTRKGFAKQKLRKLKFYATVYANYHVIPLNLGRHESKIDRLLAVNPDVNEIRPVITLEADNVDFCRQKNLL